MPELWEKCHSCCHIVSYFTIVQYKVPIVMTYSQLWNMKSFKKSRLWVIKLQLWEIMSQLGDLKSQLLKKKIYFEAETDFHRILYKETNRIVLNRTAGRHQHTLTPPYENTHWKACCIHTHTPELEAARSVNKLKQAVLLFN